MELQTLAFGVLAGLAATWTMDRLALLARRTGLTAGLDRRWMGRWFRGLLQGRLVHADITRAPAHPNEGRLALVGHYAIGVALAVGYLLAASTLGTGPDGLLPALAYGFATNAFPWFLMFPAMGFGVLGLRGPRGAMLLRSSAASHLFYGLGLWWTAQVLPLG